MGRQELADFLVGARRQAGRTQEQVAEVLGITPAQVSRWERGTQLPNLKRLPALAAAVAADVADLSRLVAAAALEEAQVLRRELGTVAAKLDEMERLTLDAFERIADTLERQGDDIATIKDRCLERVKA